jgi:cell division transport system permease protein
MQKQESGLSTGGLTNRISDMLLFILKESLISIRKAKGSFLISLVSTSISIFLITLSWFLFDVSGAVQTKLKTNIILNIFLSESLNDQDIALLEMELGKLEYIASAEFISKKAAAEQFIKDTGEDFSKVLDFNPLPASYKIKMNEEFISPEMLRRAVGEISAIKGVDEVVYQSDTAEKIFSFINQSKKYVLALTIILVLISIYIIYSTSKLILKTRVDEMETMKLIGARISTIKLPVIINAGITGLVAGLFSFLIFSLFNNGIEDYIRIHISYRIEYFFLLSVTILTGPVLGVIISYLTLRKVTLKV